MEAAPLNPSDFLFVRGMYGVRPAFPSSVGAEGVGRVAKIGSKVMLLCRVSESDSPDLRAGTWATKLSPSAQPRAMSDEAIPCNLR